MRSRDSNDPLYSYAEVAALPDQWEKCSPNDYPDEYAVKVIRYHEHDIYNCAVVVENDEHGYHVYLAHPDNGRIFHVISDRIEDDEVSHNEDVHDHYAEYAAVNLARWWMDRNRDPSRYLP